MGIVSGIVFFVRALLSNRAAIAADGTANPIPTLPPERLMIAELIPINSPFMLTSAPPELPGLIDASV